jgi:eukaryotic-like serine/threonine-protein kinase
MTQASHVDKLGRYTLIAEIARGGMGIVYLAVIERGSQLGRLYVVKVLNIAEEHTRKHIDAFMAEAELAGRLHHPNTVETTEVSMSGSRHYMVMEHLDGQPVSRIVSRFRKRGERPPLVLGRVVEQALLGLHAAHELRKFEDGALLNVVHRDATPQNIVVTYDGHVKVVDFGISLTSETESAEGRMSGKAPFMPPEQAQAQPTDRRADIFAMGLVLFELVTSKRIWRSRSDREILEHLFQSGVPDPLDVDPDLPVPIAEVVRKATQSDSNMRYATAKEMMVALAKALSSLGVPEYAPQAVAEAFAPMFEDDRARMKEIIAQQLARIDAAGTALENVDILEIGAVAGPASSHYPLTPAFSSRPAEKPELRPSTSKSATAKELSQRPPKSRSSFVSFLAVVLLLALGAAWFKLRSP